MNGVIGSREALQHLPLIWREFGSGCALRCLAVVFTFRKATFLELIDRPEKTAEKV
ncbi:MAG: hypothetical protein H6Q89_3678 [Myxococcaceae bacterium]|nr:hypothetical protein [Myxococcaceae bacterium]